MTELRHVDEDCKALSCWISAGQQAQAQLHGLQAAMVLLKMHRCTSGRNPKQVSLPADTDDLEGLRACGDRVTQNFRGNVVNTG